MRKTYKSQSQKLKGNSACMYVLSFMNFGFLKLAVKKEKVATARDARHARALCTYIVYGINMQYVCTYPNIKLWYVFEGIYQMQSEKTCKTLDTYTYIQTKTYIHIIK